MNQIQIFTLIYAERPTTSNTLATLNGPTTHNTFDDAISALFEYVKGRIIDCCPEAFIENFNLVPAKPDTTYQELHGCFNVLSAPQIVQVVDFYFGHMNDESSECFYKIDTHNINF